MESFAYATVVCNVLASVSVVSALLVITVSSPVSSVLWLILAYIAVACYLVTAGMTYIGLSYVIVYVGAISILFLFVVMMLNLSASDIAPGMSDTTSNTWPLAVLIVLLAAYGLVPLSSSVDFTLPTSVMGVLNMPLLGGVDPVSDSSLLAAGEGVNQWWAHDLDASLGGLSQVQVLGLTLYTSGALWLMLISVLLMLAMLVPLALAYTG